MTKVFREKRANGYILPTISVVVLLGILFAAVIYSNRPKADEDDAKPAGESERASAQAEGRQPVGSRFKSGRQPRDFEPVDVAAGPRSIEAPRSIETTDLNSPTEPAVTRDSDIQAMAGGADADLRRSAAKARPGKTAEPKIYRYTKPAGGEVIAGVPHVRQRPDFCGEACLEMYLAKLGAKISQDDVFNASQLNPVLGRGCYAPELVRAAKSLGFQVGPVWFSVAAKNADKSLQALFEDIRSDLRRGIPSAVCMRADESPDTTEHFRLIVGYDAKLDAVIYHEPAADNGGYLATSRQRFFQLWPLKYRQDRWTVIRLRLATSSLPTKSATTEKKATFSPADYAQHIMKLKERLPHRNFQIVISEPFVVVGDEDLRTVQQRAQQTVAWSVKHLKELYFRRDPERILDVWLFKNKSSYETNVAKVFSDKPTTPFGYYSRRHRALIMNIATGGGTLVHEIVHPFIESNFPRCPSWFNEGLASLYEQCGRNNQRIWGFTNWRLRGLQVAIQSKRVPSFKTLCSTSTNEFYDEDPGTNYSQARYLCYYLQSRGLLQKYYTAFRKNARQDPSGYKTLQQVLGRTDMDAFKKDWEAFVMKLRYPS